MTAECAGAIVMWFVFALAVALVALAHAAALAALDHWREIRARRPTKARLLRNQKPRRKERR